MHGAAADVVDRAHVPAQMMQARRARFDEGDHMMIAAVNAVQEGDAVAGPVGEAQAERSRIELNRLLDVAREQEDMRQAPGRDARNVAPERRAALARADGDLGEIRLLVGRGFRRDLDFDQVAVVIVKPEAVRFDARRRIEPLDAELLKPLGEAVEIVVKRAERDMSELLARALAERDPDMRSCRASSWPGDRRSHRSQGRTRRRNFWRPRDREQRNENGRRNGHRVRRDVGSA